MYGWYGHLKLFFKFIFLGIYAKTKAEYPRKKFPFRIRKTRMAKPYICRFKKTYTYIFADVKVICFLK